MRKKKKIVLLLVMACLLTLLPVQYASATYTRRGVSSQLNTLINQYVGKQFTGKFAGGSQCYGFAHMIFDNLFSRGSKNVGSYQNATKWKFLNPASDITTVGVLDPGYSLASLENLLEKTAPGDYVQVRRRKNQGPHSMIVVNVDAAANTIEIFDSNFKGKLLNAHYTQSFQTFYDSNDGVSVYRYSDYDPGTGPSYKTGKYKVSTSSGLPLILRGGAGTNYENKASVPNGTELVVTQVSGSWGNVCYNGIYGWVHLGYCTYIGETSHEHSYTEFVFVEADHPHYKCYKCTGCDSVVRNTSEPTIYEGCTSGACKYTGLGDSFYARILKADTGVPLVNEEPGVAAGNVALGTEVSS